MDVLGSITPSVFPETMRVAVISTSHLTHLDHDILESIADGLEIPDKPILMLDDTNGGYWVYCDLSCGLDGITAFGFSPAFENVLRLAGNQGFTYVRFDQDGPVADALPVFEWAPPRKEVVVALEAALATMGDDMNTRSGKTLFGFRELALSARATQDEIIAASRRSGSEIFKRQTYQYQVVRKASI